MRPRSGGPRPKQPRPDRSTPRRVHARRWARSNGSSRTAAPRSSCEAEAIITRAREEAATILRDACQVAYAVLQPEPVAQPEPVVQPEPVPARAGCPARAGRRSPSPFSEPEPTHSSFEAALAASNATIPGPIAEPVPEAAR